MPEGTSVPSAVAFGGDVRVYGRATEAVVTFGGDVVVDGSVGNSVVAFGGDVTVNGTVGATIVAFGGDVRLGKTAVVGSDMSPDEASIVLMGGRLTKAEGAQVNGLVKRSAGGIDPGDAVAWLTRGVFFNPLLELSFGGWLVQTAFFLVLALVAAALMPKQLRGLHSQLALRPWGALGWGALTFFLILPAVLVVLVISIIGLLLVLPYVVVVLLAYFFVTTGVASFLAQKVLTGFGGRENLMLAVTVGVVGTTVVSRIPVLGPLFLLVMMVIGTGAAVLGFARWRRERRAAEAARAAAAAPPASPPAAVPDITPIVQTSPELQDQSRPPVVPEPQGAAPEPPAAPPEPPAGAPPVEPPAAPAPPGPAGVEQEDPDAGPGEERSV